MTQRKESGIIGADHIFWASPQSEPGARERSAKLTDIANGADEPSRELIDSRSMKAFIDNCIG